MIPPEQNGEFVARMEEILDTYCLPYDPAIPLICMDEQPVQLLKETRTPLPARPGSPARVDYEYERNGTANIFLFTEPLERVHDFLLSLRTLGDAYEEIPQ